MCQNDLCFPFHFYQTPLGVAVLEGLIKTLSSRHRCTKDRDDSSATGVALISAEIQPESSGFLGVIFPDKLKTVTLIIHVFPICLLHQLNFHNWLSS